MKIDIVEVFTRAAKITWRHKILWIFGILASCGRSSGGNSNSGSRNGSGTGENLLSPEMMRQAEAFFESIGSWFEQNTWIIFAIVAFAIIAVVLQIFFTLVGTAGLARGVVHVENGVETLRFGELFSESLGYFWRLFGAALVIWLPYLTVLILSILAMLLPAIKGGFDETAMLSGAGLFLLAFCCCAFPFSLALTLYHVQVKRSIIVEDMGVFGALARGWQVFSQNIVALLIIGIVLFIASLIIGILLAMPVVLLILPLMQAFIWGNITSWQPFIAVGVFILCYSPVAWFISGILTTYTESVWTVAYLRSTQPREDAPIFVEANA